jgi:exopolyphosphatase / guanosine-5'-triphosphate,3'-diphosphate pyrophosphatase
MHINVLDLGSNSFHLLQAHVSAGGVECVGDRKHSVRLGEKAFRNGEIDPGDWQTGIAALGDLLSTARASSPHVVAVATSVFRDARNGRAFLADVQERLGLEVELLSEGSEAELSLRGALQSLSPDRRHHESALVVDIGGGSLELALGDQSRCVMRCSLPLGVLRVSNACLPTDRVLRVAGIANIERVVRTALRETSEAMRAHRSFDLVLASGTARRIAKLTTSELVGPGVWRLTRTAIRELVDEMVDRTPAQLIARGVPLARADTLAAGSVALGTVLDLFACDSALVTSTGLREGVAARAAAR